MDDKARAAIRSEAADIRYELTRTRLFGDPVDTADPDQLLVAAFHIGRARWSALYHWHDGKGGIEIGFDPS